MAAKRRIIIGVFLFFLFITLFVTVVSAASRTLRVQETDFVKVNVAAIDPDDDHINYSFGSPLDKRGEWQTDYGDAGEYNIEITASDGLNQVIETIHLIVEPRNKPPVVKDKKIVVKQQEIVDFRKVVEDPNNDPLNFFFPKPLNKQGEWIPGYDDQGSYVFTFNVSDGEFTIPARIEVVVLPVNQPPVVKEGYVRQFLKEGETFSFSVVVEDKNDDVVNYNWTLDGHQVSDLKEGSFYFDYDSKGEHVLSLKVGDGEFIVEKSWKIDVENTNRPPLLEAKLLTIREGELLNLSGLARDEDGDLLKYDFGGNVDQNGIWQTNYEDAGSYAVPVVVSDGLLTAETVLKIVVLDVDRPPVLTLPERFEAWEGQQFLFLFATQDPDGDVVTVNLFDAPEGFRLDPLDAMGKEVKLLGSPSYDVLSRRGGIWSNFLNTIRLEKFVLRSRDYLLRVQACGQEVCTTKNVRLTVHNVNRPPVFTVLEDVNGPEKVNLKIVPQAVDPDRDIVHYYYTKPFNVKGEWQPGYDQEGNYTVYVTATDGVEGTTKPVNVYVGRANRPPRLTVTDDVAVNEGQAFSLKVVPSDPDQDHLVVSLENVPQGASFKEGVFSWTPPYDFVQKSGGDWWYRWLGLADYFNRKWSGEKEITWLKFKISDGEIETIHPVKISVKNVNRPPIIVDATQNTSLTVPVGAPLLFHVFAQDPDQDVVTYQWNFGLRQEGVKGTDTIERTFVAPGQKTVSVVVSDGRSVVEKLWHVEVVPSALDQVLQVQEVTVQTYVVSQ